MPMPSSCQNYPQFAAAIACLDMAAWGEERPIDDFEIYLPRHSPPELKAGQMAMCPWPRHACLRDSPRTTVSSNDACGMVVLS